MEDPFGNTIYFDYQAGGIGELLPSLIMYGAGATPGFGSREIHFLYEDRPDPRLMYSGGVELHQDKRLTEIQVVSNGGMFRRYAFSYADTGHTTKRSRLHRCRSSETTAPRTRRSGRARACRRGHSPTAML
jgi:hypothetical protein